MPIIKSPNDIPRVQAWVIDVLRELVPLFLTLLYERERQRLVADVAPMDLALNNSPPRPPPGVTPGKGQVKEQLRRHAKALKPKEDNAGINENNYARAVRYLTECGSLNHAGRDAIIKAFEVDVESEKKSASDMTPGAGGFLIKFAVKLQTAIDKAEQVTAVRDRDDPFSSVATDNGSDNEIVGSHSLMSKDTKESHPFFDDATVMASVASLSVFQIMLEEVSAPGADRLNWQKILHYFIRFPLASGGWERKAMALFLSSNRQTIPKFADLPELADLKKARIPVSEAEKWWTGERAQKLQQMYVDLEKTLTRYRYP
jgi:hypothetical protein